MRRWAGLALCALAACGGGSSELIDQADDALADLDSGRIELQFTATAHDADSGESTDPVGFELSGAFDLDAGETFPILDLTYTRLLGGDEEAVTVQSDGDHLFVTQDGSAVEVPPEQAGPLRKSDAQSEGVTEGLGISGWINGAKEHPGPEADGAPTTRISGSADAVDLLNDLGTLTAQLSGEETFKPIAGEDAERLRAALRSGTVQVDVGESDHVPRLIVAELDFGGSIPAELAAALGPYGGAKLELDVSITDPNGSITPPELPG